MASGSTALASAASNLVLTTAAAVTNAAGSIAASAVYSVYQSVTAGKPYFGMTKEIARRGREHLNGPKAMSIREIVGNLTKEEARGVEQVLIEARGLKKNGGDLLNQINSISPSGQDYQRLTAKGREVLEAIGYKPSGSP